MTKSRFLGALCATLFALCLWTTLAPPAHSQQTPYPVVTSTNPATHALAVTLSGNTTLTFQSRGIIVGGAGSMVCTFAGDTVAVTLPTLNAGVVYPFSLSQINASGTSATGIVELY